MEVIAWSDLAIEIRNYIETEEWVQVKQNKRQQVLEDLRDPKNMVTLLRFRPGHDMINLKVYRPDGLTKMTTFKLWVFIPGISDLIRKFHADGRKSDN